ncbi:flagellar hook protein FlgE [Sphingomonas guangdongensis]|uniref:Flagellar hook protein FlgE n=1 Tax=Sphingomonas guangdongensis TaxID=1141890 RepID=A0A285QE41_9SPHN|nr:flagellar hook protein FlgE [Sphingomonas guangdongensis]SOB80200.1 flagellar hook protein FlgE [Sphingomonas guangdongensis]
MSFYTSLSGLQASQTEMSTISHNLANVATNGFKKSRTEFADVMASSVSMSPTQMIGSGTIVKAIRQQFGQGASIQSTNALDLMISGEGFFAVKPDPDSAKVAFTRNGGFSVNADRFVTDSNGGHLQVYPVDGSGTVVATGLDSTINLQLPPTSGTPKPTEVVSLAVNLSANATVPKDNPVFNTTTNPYAFDRFNPATYNNSSQTIVYDAVGNATTMTNYYIRDTVSTGAGSNSNWLVYTFVGDRQMQVAGSNDPTTMTFDSSGAKVAPSSAIQFDAFTPNGTTTPQQVTLDFGTATTQLGQPFSKLMETQDGRAVGQLEGVSVGEDGIVRASFSNGDTQALGKVVLANFSNPSGLRQLGNSYWTSTGVSGEARLGEAGANGFGSLMSGAVERSNVDITEELVGLIAAQRNFQANAKALDTSSQTSQTILNIRN